MHQLFIDLKKAYDSVRREVFYNILNEFGIPTGKANKKVSEWNIQHSLGKQAFVWHITYLAWFETRCFITIAFPLCFRARH